MDKKINGFLYVRWRTFGRTVGWLLKYLYMYMLCLWWSIGQMMVDKTC